MAGTKLAQSLPRIKSFDYVVEPHRLIKAGASDPGPRRGAPPQPPTILSILPEGSRVKAGEVVCELESSSFRDELLIQRIRYERAKAWVDQARSVLEVNELSARAYEHGTLSQDLELIRQFRKICETEADRAQRALNWSSMASANGLLSTAQADADRLAFQEAQIKLQLAAGMQQRLTKYSSSRIRMAHQSKIEATRADKLSLEYAFQLEAERLRRIETMIANCTMRAPSDGIIIYANKTNSWGRVETQIEKGITVYETQPIFRMLDPKHLKVKARINESLVARIKEGMKALIRLDAFPEQQFQGEVQEITPIPSPVNGGFSDVRAYYASVALDANGFENLRAGLTGEVEFVLEPKRQVPRVPLEAIRWIGRQAYAALVKPGDDALTCRWLPVSVGQTDSRFAEVLSGLNLGDNLYAHPELLPAPNPKASRQSLIALQDFVEARDE